MLVRLLYASRTSTPLTPEAIDAILGQSRRNNPALGVTGVLCFSDDVLMQILEGGRDNVCELFNEIVRDGRHTSVRILLYEEIVERRFGNWTMGHVSSRKIGTTLLLRYGEQPQLDPFACSGHASLALLEDLISTGLIASHSPG